jgi:hypothetical protein
MIGGVAFTRAGFTGSSQVVSFLESDRGQLAARDAQRRPATSASCDPINRISVGAIGQAIVCLQRICGTASARELCSDPVAALASLRRFLTARPKRAEVEVCVASEAFVRCEGR